MEIEALVKMSNANHSFLRQRVHQAMFLIITYDHFSSVRSILLLCEKAADDELSRLFKIQTVFRASSMIVLSSICSVKK